VKGRNHVSSPAGVARPFLKWAGGKRQLLPLLRVFYPRTFERYHEPFLGSGAVFFDLHGRGLLQHRAVRLADNNADLVGCYTVVRAQVGTVIEELRTLDRRHRLDPERHFYRVRDGLFNPMRRARAMNGQVGEDYTPELAAMLIYLNRTAYNGLFRLNAQCGFNVPLGRYTNPRICDEGNLRLASEALGAQDTCVRRANFDNLATEAGRGDFLYFDPPYAPLSETADFTSYTADGFSQRDQQELQRLAIELAARGCHVLLSNSTAPSVAALYDDNADAKAAGLKAYRIPARRAINSKGAQRGAVQEYLITNIPPKS
jgi:DNA adenine methylase